MQLYRKIELQEGTLVQYVGGYVLRMNGGVIIPDVGFVEADDIAAIPRSDLDKVVQYLIDGHPDDALELLRRYE